MKVVFTMTFAERLGGAENVLWTVLKHLDRERFDPIVVFFDDGPFEREVAGLGIPTEVVHPGRIRNVGQGLGAIRELAAIFRRERPRLIVHWLLKAQIYGAPAAMLARMTDRAVWWQHDLPGRQRLDRLATILPARAIGAPSRASAAAQARFWPRRPTFAVLPGVPTPRTASDAEVAALRDRLDLPADRPIVGIVGRLQPWKGQHRFLEALALLRRQGHDLHGLIVGGRQHEISPEYEPFVRRRVGELGLEGAVTFTGQVPEAGPYLQLMDVFVNASEPEPFGLVVLEAMAVGVPVVAVDAAGPREILDGGAVGILAANGHPEELSRCIERLVVAPELRAHFSEAGRARFTPYFTIERMMDEMHARLTELAAA